MKKSTIVYLAVMVSLLTLLSIVMPMFTVISVPIVLGVLIVKNGLRITNLGLLLIVLITIFGFLIYYFESLKYPFYLVAGILLCLSLFDILWLSFLVKIKVKRELPGRFALNSEGEVKLIIYNRSNFTVDFILFDGVPQESNCEQMPWHDSVKSLSFLEIKYDLSISKRGWSKFSKTFVNVTAPLKLWRKTYKSGIAEKVRVYPNYEPVLRLALLAMENSPEQMGIIKKQWAGLSKEFHQLRDYHQGDALTQIDWKASAKKQALISRDYQEERDQTIILAIDCGRKMRAEDRGVSQFDHCLNALLLVAYVALKQGDHVGVMAYGGREHYLSPLRGVDSMTTILNHLFDYQTTSSPSDYGEAAERIMIHQQRRAMVLFLSNFRGEDASELYEPLKKLRQKHVVGIGNILEAEVKEISQQKIVNSLEDALSVAAVEDYLTLRKKTMGQLAELNIASVDVTASELPIALANLYLAQREIV